MDDIFRIAICDDDEIIRKKLNGYITEWIHRQGNKGIVDAYDSGVSLLQDIKEHDLIFLDIEMPELDGIETAKRIREVNKRVPIIYATNYEDYHNLAFSVHAFGYLVKPIETEEVYKILSEFIDYYEKQDIEKCEIVLRVSGTQVKTLNVKDIYYIEYIGHKIRVKTKSGDIISRYYNMSKIFELLEKYDFDYIHKGYIVNLHEIEIVKQYEIRMTNQDIVPLAQKRAAVFRERYNLFLQKIVKSRLAIRG